MKKSELVEIYNHLLAKSADLRKNHKLAKINTWNNKEKAKLAVESLQAEYAEIISKSVKEVYPKEKSVEKFELVKVSVGNTKTEIIRNIFSQNFHIEYSLEVLARVIGSDNKNTLTLVRILSNSVRTKNPLIGVEYDRKNKKFVKKAQ